MSRLGLRVRIAAAFAAAMLLVLALAGVFVYLRVSAELSGSIDDGLRSRADDLAALAAAAGGAPDLGGGRLVEEDEGFSEILTPGGEVIATTRAAADPVLDGGELERAARGPVLLDARVGGIEGEARVLARPGNSADGPVIAVVGTSTEDRTEALAGLVQAFAIGGPVALALSSALGYLLAARALAPVSAIRRRAEEITLDRSDERLPVPAAEDELRELAETLNAMLDRIEASLARERVFVADASHELRTPLAVLRTELELAARPGRSVAELREALASALEEVVRLSRLADDLLVIARTDQGRLPIATETVGLSPLLGRVRDRFQAAAGAAGRSIAVEAEAGESAELDPLRMEQALGNLVDNALRHGAGEVRLRGAIEEDTVVLAVGDQGGGFDHDLGERAFERFTRGEPARSGAGAGLGLAIVRAIARAHGGEVAAARGPGDGGFDVRISLPRESKALI